MCAGVDPFDPSSLPSAGGWEAGLGSHDLRGCKVAIVPDLGGVTLEPGVEDRIRAEAEALLADTGMVQVDIDVAPPNLAAQWMMGNLATLLADLGDEWPRCADDLTDEVAMGLRMSESLYNLRTAATAEELRIQANEEMAAGLRAGRLHHRGHQPRAGLRRRGVHEQQREQLPGLGPRQQARPARLPGRAAGHPAGQRLRPHDPFGPARDRHPGASRTS